MELPPLPLKQGLLERYRLASRRKLRPDLLGGHLVRRKGQSLEFREYEHYMPGDDIRHVDWRASARYGMPEDLLVRSFVAEEQFTLVLSVDTRETMYLPDDLPKLHTAAWLAEAIGSVALKEGDRVILHRLFGKGSGGATSLRGANNRARLRTLLNDMCTSPADEHTNLKVLQKWMPPTAVWVILTDLYFHTPEAAKTLANRIARAHDGMRWVILVDLDSWPAERYRLGVGARRLEGPGLDIQEPVYEIDEQALQAVEQRIRDHKRHFMEQAHASRCDLDVWHWPATEEIDTESFFKRRFLGDPILQRLFMRDAL